MAIKPDKRPNMGLADVLRFVKAAGQEDKFCLVGIRGYYLNSMGRKGLNDRGIYDDAIVRYAPGHLQTFNANCDPSAYRKGHGTGSSKGMASLKENTAGWLYQPGLHRAGTAREHKAFRQAASVTVRRDADTAVPESKIVIVDGVRCYEETGDFAINIHRGGLNTTSSEGCQTVHPDQYANFQGESYDLLKKLNQKTFRYILLNAERFYGA